MRSLLVLAATLAACTPAEPPLLIDETNAPVTVVGAEAPTPVEHNVAISR